MGLTATPHQREMAIKVADHLASTGKNDLYQGFMVALVATFSEDFARDVHTDLNGDPDVDPACEHCGIYRVGHPPVPSCSGTGG